MTTHLRRLLLASVGAAVLNTPALAVSDDAFHTDWQLRRLFEPTPQELERESRGHIFIYHRVPDTVVTRALDEQFERVDAMMFTGTIITNSEGSEIQDPDTGEPLTEDDGC